MYEAMARLEKMLSAASSRHFLKGPLKEEPKSEKIKYEYYFYSFFEQSKAC